jgi:hypothetical protein
MPKRTAFWILAIALISMSSPVTLGFNPPLLSLCGFSTAGRHGLTRKESAWTSMSNLGRSTHVLRQRGQHCGLSATMTDGGMVRFPCHDAASVEHQTSGSENTFRHLVAGLAGGWNDSTWLRFEAYASGKRGQGRPWRRNHSDQVSLCIVSLKKDSHALFLGLGIRVWDSKKRVSAASFCLVSVEVHSTTSRGKASHVFCCHGGIYFPVARHIKQTFSHTQPQSTYTYAYIFVCMHMYVYFNMCLCVCVCVCVCVCMHVCMYVYKHTRIHA